MGTMVVINAMSSLFLPKRSIFFAFLLLLLHYDHALLHAFEPSVLSRRLYTFKNRYLTTQVHCHHKSSALAAGPTIALDQETIEPGGTILGDRQASGTLLSPLLDSGEISTESGDGTSTSAASSVASIKLCVQPIFDSLLRSFPFTLYVYETRWLSGRLEVILSASPDLEDPVSPNVEILSEFHTSFYAQIEEKAVELTHFEILIASPGVSDVLRTDRDFTSFKGFPVIVTTTEEYRKKTRFEGTLVERSAETVSVSLKGRRVDIPRSLVTEVRLPPSKYEPNDGEIRKLRPTKR